MENQETNQQKEISISAEHVSNGLLKDKKILWVEDDKFLNTIVVKRLASEGCNLITAGDGETALSLVEKDKPDIIMLDILLPGMDGYEILQKFKSNPASADIPVIMLSNLGQKSDLDKAKELGATKFLIKATVNLDEIIAEIGNVLNAPTAQ